jgi:phosphoribosyl-ATP pyrophosphohydrolase
VDFVKFLQDGVTIQQQMAKKSGSLGPLDLTEEWQHHSKVLEHIGHLMEEAIELRMLVPRRSWKKNEYNYLSTPENKKEFLYELVDILLFYRAILAYSGISIEEFIQALNDKLEYNSVREDHK